MIESVDTPVSKNLKAIEPVDCSPSLNTTGTMDDRVILNDWHAIAAVDALQPGTLQSVRLLDRDLVLWRGENQLIQVWEDRCPHRSVRLSGGKVVENTVVCPYHGMVYNSEGRCIRVPAHPDYVPPKQACVRQYAVQERYGLVFVCLGDEPKEIAPFLEWEDASYLKVLSGPHFCRTGGYRAIENFLDVAHFAHVHTDILGDLNIPEVGDYDVTTDDRGVHFHNIRVWQPDPMGKGQGAYVTYDYSVYRPLTAYFRKGNPAGECLTILYCVTPVSEEECISWLWMAVNFMDSSQTEAAIAFQDHIFSQDLANLESHNPKRLPLNPTAEFHVPCDQGSLAYRQWLKRLGVTYGVIL
ncbi:MAG: aromatic ring-hydroxylating dioxygenase subunit alpha [Leptolyngbyaceae cyanobacterium bins.302]|nr:aromatic ring-hydroxylating dioxygenase subunit alpha [Leptolyngbyaceae cyanobacterium bins.302]